MKYIKHLRILTVYDSLVMLLQKYLQHIVLARTEPMSYY